MRPPPFSRAPSRRLVWLGIAAVALALLVGGFVLRPRPSQTSDTTIPRSTTPAAGPPWRYGAADARFTLILYADFECPYCKAYFPVIKTWVDQHPDARLQWHHLPLPMHEPAASKLASLAECVGETGGQAAYWNAATWIYQHTRGDGLGLPDGTRYPDLTPDQQACLDGGHAQAAVQTQAREGVRDGVTATPTLRLRDEHTGQSLLLHGPVEGDALLSALDFLAAGQPPTVPSDPAAMPDDVDGVKPR
ncbi:DsbA family protein [Xanthomonas euvesicatoria]|uniref:DsbA family protein n=1 Tax=Xanthomonas euvesicatoria TaxID=456327 RepID=UPI001C470B44|nr:thioredoxin domain-containing protein [Xanthomonas euvesicatoria]MBV6791648.1 thioredoxin domain-containing protein [Xanthomonas campestris pv. clerodendri]